jgi:hypothetical protein
MIMNIKELLSWSYLTQTPSLQFTYGKVVLFITLSLFLVSIALFVYSSKKITDLPLHRKIFFRCGIFLLSLSLLLGFDLFSRIQGLPVLSLRIVFAVWVILVFAGILYVGYYFFWKYPDRVRVYKKEEIKKKYLPGKKK